MNIYEALNQGDGSLKEPHFTSLLFYLFKVSKDEFPRSSFLDLFIERFATGYPNSNDCDFDLDTDIKIEEILIYNNLRRDTDIIVFLRQNGLLRIINIENKITNLSYQTDQISEQHSILSSLYPNSEIKNILILPYPSEQILIQDENVDVVYWLSEDNSVIAAISDYINETINNNNLQIEKIHFLKTCLGLFEKFSFVLEQDRLSNENMVRGPRNILRLTMFEYLTNIANNWENIFEDNPENVTVSQLLDEFERVVSEDLEEDFPNNYQDKIAKFKRGALEAQPKIVTINERNRVHFNITNPDVKKLFYYPDIPNGNYAVRWKDVRIKPLRLMNEDNQYFIYWKDNITNEIQIDLYIP